jgi:hypothetical protein
MDTIREFIDAKKIDKYRYELFNKQYILEYPQKMGINGDLIKISLYNIITNHIDFLKEIYISTKMNPEWRYAPKTLSWEIYSMIEMWHILLIINKCRCTEDFVMDKIVYLDPAKYDDYIARIFFLEDIKLS